MTVMNKIAFILIFLLLATLAYANLIFNEVMSNPLYDESLNEWVELHNNGSSPINVSGFIIGDDNDNDTIEGALYNKAGTIIPAFGYAVITDDATRVYENFNVSKAAIHLYIDDSSIGNGLSNSGETLYLYNNTTIIDKITYSSTDDDKSWASINGIFLEANATPGYNNNGSTITYTDNTCDWKIENILNKTIFDNSSDFSFKSKAVKLNGNKTNITATAVIEDANNNKVQSYNIFTNDESTTQKTSSTYTPNLAENQLYFLKTNLTVQCNDTYIDNNYITSLFSVKYSALLNTNSYITIQNIYDLGSDDKASFGQIVKARLNAYKGNTSKESISLWMEKGSDRITKESSISLENKFTNYTLTVPLQIKANCDRDFEDGKYTLRVEGLDTSAESTVEVDDITDDLCEEIEVEEKSTKRSKIEMEIAELPAAIKTGQEFPLKIRLINKGDVSREAELWSYVFRGPKSYSGSREDNKKLVSIMEDSSEVIELRNEVEEAEPGDYKIKISYKLEGQKTVHDSTYDIKVIGSRISAAESSVSLAAEGNEAYGEANPIEAELSGYTLLMPKSKMIVYESSGEKAKKLIPTIFVITSLLVSVIAVMQMAKNR